MALSKEQYEQLRRRLLAFFSHRAGTSADELADETLYRLTVKLESGAEIPPADIERYAIGIAKHVFQESCRKPLHFAASLEDPNVAKEVETQSRPANFAPERLLLNQAEQNCLHQCLRKLAEKQRQLILNYYKDDWHEQVESRKRLLKTTGMSQGTLGKTVSRILEKLEACMKQCQGIRK